MSSNNRLKGDFIHKSCENMTRHYFMLKTSRFRLLQFFKSLKHFRFDACFLAFRGIHLTPLGVFGCLSHQFFPKNLDFLRIPESTSLLRTKLFLLRTSNESIL